MVIIDKMSFEVKQLQVGGFDHNFSYLISCRNSGETVIIDPCGDIAVIKKALAALPKHRPAYILLTHSHHDHISGLERVKQFFPAPVMAHPLANVPVTPLQNGQQLPFGDGFIEILYAPGHTKDSVIYRLNDDSAIFTGDTLFVDWCGYCEATEMFRTMRKVILPLSDSNVAYSGHDYGHAPYSRLGDEKKSNPYLNTDNFAEFNRRLRQL